MASRGDRFLGILGLGVACGALLAYGATFAHVAVHDTYAASFMLLGIVAVIVFCPFFLRACGALAKEPLAGLLRIVSPLQAPSLTSGSTTNSPNTAFPVKRRGSTPLRRMAEFVKSVVTSITRSAAISGARLHRSSLRSPLCRRSSTFAVCRE